MGGCEVKYRIIEYQPKRYRIEKRRIFWRKIKLVFSELTDAEYHVEHDIWEAKEKLKLRGFKSRIVKEF